MNKPEKKPSKVNFWIAAMIVGLPLIWTIPTFYYMREKTKNSNAQSVAQMQLLGDALMNYTKSNGRYPVANNWIAPLSLQNGDLKNPADTDKTHVSSYAMNANLSGIKVSDIKNPHNVILLYETTSKDAVPSGLGDDIVKIGKEQGGLGRHYLVGYRFNYYVMADGSVRYPRIPEDVKNFLWK